jgi:hypothetical protein
MAITIEFWGPHNTESNLMVLKKNSEMTNVKLEQAYAYAKMEKSAEIVGGYIKIIVNGKWIPSYKFTSDYERTHKQEKRNLKIYVEYPGDKFVLVDDETKQDVFRGDKWEVEKYLDEHGYFQDDEPKFSI